MPVSPTPASLSFFSRLTRLCAIVVTLVGAVVLLGWVVGSATLKSVVPGWATMKVNTAICLAAAGASLWCLRNPAPTNAERMTGRLLAAVVAAIGALTLFEYLAEFDFGIDQLLFRDPETPAASHPGRMAHATAVNFVMHGFALWLLGSRPRISQWLAVLLLGSSALAIVGHCFGVSSLYRVASYSSVAVHTAVAFAVSAVGILTARPGQGFMIIVASDSAGGITARRLLPLMPTVLFAIGLLRLAGEIHGLYDGRFGLALMVTLAMTVTVLLVGLTARSLYHLDLRRKLAEDEIRQLNESLERKVAERTRELETSLAQVKHLHGLLPMCAWCKKIRDDRDYWVSVESYVTARTDARFTHGICPTCLTDAMKEVQ